MQPGYRYRFITSTQSSSGDWKEVKPALDFETTLLEIKTNSWLGSGDEVRVYFYNSQGDWAGGVRMIFHSILQHWISWCIPSWTYFPSTLPTAADKVWRISLNKTSDITLQIHCNDIEVVNILMSDDTCDDSNWRKYWSGDVDKMYFPRNDNASDYYRPFTPGRHCKLCANLQYYNSRYILETNYLIDH